MKNRKLALVLAFAGVFLLGAGAVLLLPGGALQWASRGNAPTPAQALPASAAGARTAHPITGTLVIRVPAGIIGTQYWVYVNGDIVSAPPHEPFPTFAPDTIVVPLDNGMELWNQSGRVLGVENERYTHRPQDFEKAFQSIELTNVSAPSRYEVTLMVAGNPKDGSLSWFPFVTTANKQRIEIAAGETATLDLAPPREWAPGPRAARLKALPSNFGAPAELARQWQDELQKQMKLYDEDPVVRALLPVATQFSAAQPARARVEVELPLALGGRRTLDAAQIDAIVTALVSRYRMETGDMRRAFGSENAALSAQFEHAVEAFNANIEALRPAIADKLRAAAGRR
jgi:hypothetical protein